MQRAPWLTADRTVTRLLLGAVDPKVPEMYPTCRLSDDKCLGSDFESGDSDIHVLVKLLVASVAVSEPQRNKTRQNERVIKEDLVGALMVILHDDDNLDQEEDRCGYPRTHLERQLVETLLQMGILKRDEYTLPETCPLSVVSDMVRRIIIEAQPARVIQQGVDSPEDPVVLLLTALRHLDSRAVLRNRKSPSVSTLHFEIYAAMSDILRQWSQNKVFGAEAITPAHNRADILICGGVFWSSFEIRVNKLESSQIKEAVGQAAYYRCEFGVDRMFVVNFVPAGPAMDEVFHVEGYDNVDQGTLRQVDIEYGALEA